MPLSCSLGLHRPRSGARWNDGHYFTKCSRCGTDLVRTSGGEWQVPKGYKVVWQAEPPARRKAGPAGATPEETVPKTDTPVALARATASADSGHELPIQAVLRELNTRDLTDDNPISAVDEARQAQLVADGSQQVPRSDAEPAAEPEEEPLQNAQEEAHEEEGALHEAAAPQATGTDEEVREQADSQGEAVAEAAGVSIAQDDLSETAAVDDADGRLSSDDKPVADGAEETDAPAEAEDPPGQIDTVFPLDQVAAFGADDRGEDSSSTADDSMAGDDAVDEAAAAREEQPSKETEELNASTEASFEENEAPSDPVAPGAPQPMEAQSEPAQPEPTPISPIYDFMEDDPDIELWEPASLPTAEDVPDEDVAEESSRPVPEDASTDMPPALEEDQVPEDSFGDEPAETKGPVTSPFEKSAEAAPPLASPLKTAGARKTALRKVTAATDSKRKRMSFAAQAGITVAVALGVFALLPSLIDRPDSDGAPALSPGVGQQETAADEIREPAYVTARILNCRVSPVSQATSVRKIARGSRVEILARDEEWVSISHRGRQCWALARYISREEPA